MSGAYLASQHALLLNPSGATPDLVQAARLLRNGLAVTCFAAFEGFIYDRTAEIATWMTSQNIPFSSYPSGIKDGSARRGINYLSAIMKRDDSAAEVQQAVVQLGESWTRMSGGGWQLPHASILWPGSNLSAGEALSILSSFGVASEWGDIVGVAQAAGFANLPTKPLFDEIANRRHQSAHRAGYDADILLLRATSGNLTAFAFAVDVLLSSAARSIARNIPPVRGRNNIHLTRLDESNSDSSWDEFRGPVDPKVAAVSNAKHVDLDTGIAACKTALNGPLDVLMIRRWNGGQLVPSDWYTMGV